MDFTKKSCEEFVSVLATKEPVPGGGGAAALVGAVGVALGNMVGSLTVGKKKYADVEDEMNTLMEQDVYKRQCLQPGAVVFQSSVYRDAADGVHVEGACIRKSRQTGPKRA